VTWSRPISLETSQKESGSYLCFRCDGDDTCIPLQWQCDGQHDCSDGLDEVNCPTQEGVDSKNSEIAFVISLVSLHENVWRSGNTIPHILNIGSRWR